MKIKSRPIGDWKVSEFLEYCRDNNIDDKLISEIDIMKREEIEISDKDYELLKIAKRIFELSGINPNIVKVNSFGHVNGKNHISYEYGKNVNTLLNEALFHIELPIGTLLLSNLDEDIYNDV